MTQRARKAIGSFALIAYMITAIVLILILAERLLAGAPWWGQLAFYVVAGVIWIAPLKPLFAWMNRPDAAR